MLDQIETIRKAAEEARNNTAFALDKISKVATLAMAAEKDARKALLIAKLNNMPIIGSSARFLTAAISSKEKIVAFMRKEDSFPRDKATTDILQKISPPHLTNSSANYKNLKSKPSETNQNPSSKTNKRVVASATPPPVSSTNRTLNSEDRLKVSKNIEDSTITKAVWSLLVFVAVIFCVITIIYTNKVKKAAVAALKSAQDIKEAATSIVKTSKETAGYIKEVQEASDFVLKSEKEIKEAKTSIVKTLKETAKYAKEAKKAAAIAMESTKEIKKNSTPSLQISKRTFKYTKQDKRSTTSPFKKPNDISSEHAKKKAA